MRDGIVLQNAPPPVSRCFRQGHCWHIHSIFIFKNLILFILGSTRTSVQFRSALVTGAWSVGAFKILMLQNNVCAEYPSLALLFIKFLIRDFLSPNHKICWQRTNLFQLTLVCVCVQQTHRQRVLAYLTAGQRHQVWGVKPLVHGGSLTGVDNEEQLVVPAHGRTQKHTAL